MSESDDTELGEGSKQLFLGVYACLLALLGLTITLAHLPLGPFAVVAGLTIAATKALLIAVYYMHLRFRPHVVWVFAAATVVWLAILFGFTLSDYLTRQWILISPGA